MRPRPVLLAAAIAVVASACASGTVPTTVAPADPPPVVGTTEASGTTTAGDTTNTTEETTTSTAGVDLVAEGKTLSSRNGCAACHSPDGASLVGPTWQGLYEKVETLDDGSTIVADDDYLKESIVDPDAKIVDGFVGGVMPKGFGDRLSDGDIGAIIAYIESLR
jgi:cytochrome c oxidase subunit II